MGFLENTKNLFLPILLILISFTIISNLEWLPEELSNELDSIEPILPVKLQVNKSLIEINGLDFSINENKPTKKSKTKTKQKPPKPTKDPKTQYLEDHEVGKNWEHKMHKQYDRFRRERFWIDRRVERPNCSSTILDRKFSEQELLANKARTLNMMREKNLLNFTSSAVSKSPKKLILGILTIPSACDNRNLLRNTWLKYNIFDYRFLVDKPSPAMTKENQTFGDIVVLNAHFTGRANRFGEKLYLWLKYAKQNFPNHDLIGKADDDLFLCPLNVMSELTKVYDDYLYFGWSWFKDKVHFGKDTKPPYFRTNCGPDNCFLKCGEKASYKILNHTNPSCYYGQINRNVRHDEFFVVLGHKLVSKIIEQEYCLSSQDYNQCTNVFKPWQLVDNNYAGQSLGMWLNKIQLQHAIENGQNNLLENPLIKIERNQRRLVHYGDKLHYVTVWIEIQRRNLAKKYEWNLCDRHLAFHKAMPYDIEMLQEMVDKDFGW